MRRSCKIWIWIKIGVSNGWYFFGASSFFSFDLFGGMHGIIFIDIPRLAGFKSIMMAF
jgi:hypothetical protein